MIRIVKNDETNVTSKRQVGHYTPDDRIRITGGGNFYHYVVILLRDDWGGYHLKMPGGYVQPIDHLNLTWEVVPDDTPLTKPATPHNWGKIFPPRPFPQSQSTPLPPVTAEDKIAPTQSQPPQLTNPINSSSTMAVPPQHQADLAQTGLLLNRYYGRAKTEVVKQLLVDSVAVVELATFFLYIIGRAVVNFRRRYSFFVRKNQMKAKIIHTIHPAGYPEDAPTPYQNPPATAAKATCSASVC